MRYVKLPTDPDMYEDLTYEECGQLYIGALRYLSTGEEPEMPPNCKTAWRLIKRELDKQVQAYHNMCVRNKSNVEKRYESLPVATSRNESLPVVDLETEKERTKEQEKDDSKETLLSLDNNSKKRRVFVPPKVEEVQAYCSERNNEVDAQSFVDFYTAKDWMIGKNKMRDWRAAVRTWERSRTQPSRKNPALQYKQTPISEDDFNSLLIDLNDPNI